MRDRGGPSVCILSHSHPDFSKGGGEVAAYRQFRTQEDAGWSTTFVAASEVGSNYARRRRLDTVIPYAEDEYLFSFAGMAEDRLAWDDPYQRRTVVEFLAGLGSDVYHFHHYWRIGLDLVADLMEARPDATFVMTLHEMLAICLHHGQMIKTRGRELCRREAPMRCLSCYPEETIERLVLRKAYNLSMLRRFDQIIYPSHFIQSRYEAWGLRHPRAMVLENYLGDDLLSRPRRRNDPAIVCGRFGFFGQPTEFKGLDILLKGFALALRENPDITLTVFGAERDNIVQMFPETQRIIDGTGQNLSLAGRYDPSDVLDLMRSVGWVVIPSIWWENSPVVIQEALRAGTPMIVSDIGGMAEKVEHDVDGLHFKRGSPTDLARAILEAAQPGTRERLGRSMRDVITRDEFLDGLRTAFAPPATRQKTTPAIRFEPLEAAQAEEAPATDAGRIPLTVG